MKIEEEDPKRDRLPSTDQTEAIASHFDEAFHQPEADSDGKDRVFGILREAANWKAISRSPYGFKPLIIISLIGFFQSFDTAGFQIAAPDIVRDLGVEVTTIVAIMAIVGFFSLFTGPAIGWWSDRHKRLPLYAGGTILSGLFSMAASRGRSLLAFAIPRVGDEVANTTSSVPMFSLLVDYYPPETRGKAFAMMGTLLRVGALSATPIAGGLVVLIGWRTTTLFFGIPLIILGTLAILLLREPVRGYMERRSMGASEDVANVEDEPKSFGEAWRSMWAVRTLRRLFLSNMWGRGGSILFQAYFAFYLAEEYGLNAFQRGLLTVPVAVGGFIAGFLGGGLVDYFVRRSPARVITFFAVLDIVGALGTLAIAFRPPLAYIVISTFILSFGEALLGPAEGVVSAQVIPPSIRTQSLQVMALSALPSLLVFTPIGIQVYTNYGLQGAIFAGVPLLILSGLIKMTATSTFELDMRSAFAQALANEEWRKAKASGKGKLLVSRQVDVEYDGVQVVFGADFDVEEGQVIAVLGTNGAGKSTLLKAISGTQEASGGAIVFDGRDITHMPPHEVAARGVVHMPGGRGIFPTLSVKENLLLGSWLLTDQEEARSRLKEVFEIFPILRERANEPAGALSGGEQQMVSLAQAFLSKPKLLMIDELSLGLSPAVVGQLLEIVREINRRGVTIIIVEQSVSVALNIADEAIFMEKGEVKFVGPTKELLNRPDILRAVYMKGTGALGPAVHVGLKETSKIGSPILKVEGLVKVYGGVTAVDHVSFDLRENEVLGLIGPNGAGKTTLFDLISGNQIPDEGTVTYEGVDITDLRPEERAKKRLIRRFQDARLFPSLTVHEALLVALEQRMEVKNPLLTLSQLPGPRRAERRLRVQADRLLELLGLESYRGKFVRELSTGVRRILDICCVLASQPKVLLLDEPSTGIAQAEAAGLGPLLRQVKEETGCSILIIEHTMSLISAVSDELLALDQGRVIMRGTPEEVLNDERVIEAYLGGSEAAINR